MARDVNVITTISEKEKSVVCLVADDHGNLLIRKELCGEEKQKLYQRIQETESPYFPKILEVYAEEGKTVVLEEYLEGEDLARLLGGKADGRETAGEGADDGPKRRSEAETGQMLDHAEQLIRAVQTLHHLEPPLIHRDVKPENILITKDHQLKLLDFDAAREWCGDEKEQDTVLLGTRGYAAPEQFGYSQTDVRSDLYSVGIVCARISERVILPKARQKRLKAFLDKATMFDPNERFQTADEMLKDFEGIRAGQGRRHKGAWKSYAAGAALLFLILGGMWLLFGKEGARDPARAALETDGAAETETKEGAENETGNVRACKNGVTDLDVLPPEYRQKSIASRVRNAEATIKDWQIPEVTYEADNADGFFSADRECAIGTERPLLRFLKAYPQAILFYDYRTEEQGDLVAKLTRYSPNGSKAVDHLTISCEEGRGGYSGLTCLKAEDLNRLQTGIYELEFCFQKGLILSYYLQIHGEEEKVDDFAVRAIDPVQYYSESIKNDVFFNVCNTPYGIEKIYCDGEEVPQGTYLLTADGRGAILKEDFFAGRGTGKTLEVCFEMRNQRKAYGKVVWLP